MKCGEGESAYDDLDGEIAYGFLYHGITYADEAVLPEDKGKLTVRFWHPKMTRGGEIEFLRPEQCVEKRHIKEIIHIIRQIENPKILMKILTVAKTHLAILNGEV